MTAATQSEKQLILAMGELWLIYEDCLRERGLDPRKETEFFFDATDDGVVYEVVLKRKFA